MRVIEKIEIRQSSVLHNSIQNEINRTSQLTIQVQDRIMFFDAVKQKLFHEWYIISDE